MINVIPEIVGLTVNPKVVTVNISQTGPQGPKGTSIGLTTSGNSGSATLLGNTLNIPTYTLAGLGGINSTRSLSINGTSYDLSADRSWSVGTVTSIGLTLPTGFSVSPASITSSGTFAVSFSSGYSLPTTVKQSNWDDSYTWVAAFPTQTGNSGKYLTTNGTALSWSTVDALPSQIGNSGKYLTTNGTIASWSTIDLSAFVPTTRTLTINGNAYDLSLDRSWSVGTVTSVAALTIGTTGTDVTSSVATGTTTPVITLNIPTASSFNRGVLYNHKLRQ
jgi:predicted heme/steroid binding protein